MSDEVQALGTEYRTFYHCGRREFAIKECNGYTLSFGQPTNEPATCPET